jgi:hypothetical protein
VNRRDASIVLEAKPSAVTRLPGDRKPACSQRSEVAQYRATRDTQLVGEGVDGRHIATTQKIGKVQKAVGSRHLW